MSDTPRTDAAWKTWIATGCAQRLLEESKKLERELAEAKRIMRGILDNDGSGRIYNALALAEYRDEAKRIFEKSQP